MPICPSPRWRARSLILAASAPVITPPSSHRSRSSATPCPCSTANRAPPVSTSCSVFRSGSRHTPAVPTPRGIARSSRSMTAGNRGCSSSRSSPSPTKSLTPHEISKPTPPGETTPSLSTSVAATPPIGKPYPQCTSGIAYEARTIPGSVATLTTCIKGHVAFVTRQQRPGREHDPGHPHRALLFDPEPVWGLLDDFHESGLNSHIERYRTSPAVATLREPKFVE